MSEKRGLFKNIASLGVVQVANLILPLISIPIISRIIGPDKFGVVNYAATFIGYFTLLIDYGFNLTATRRVAKDPNNKELRDLVFSEVLYAKIFLFLISIVLFIPCVLFFEPLLLEKKVAVFTFLTCIASLLSQNWFFQAMQDLSKVAVLNFLSKLLFTIFVLLLVRQKQDYIWMPLITSLVAILVGWISYYWGIRKYNIILRRISLKKIFNLLNREKTIFFSTVVINLYTATNIVVLGIMQSEESVGYYTAAQKLILISIGVINIPLAQAFYPYIGKAFGKSKEEGLQTTQKIFPWVIILTSISGVIMYLFAGIGINILYGKDFKPSIHVFRVLTLVPLLIAISNSFGIQIMMNLNMDKLFFRITSSGALLGLVLNVVMIKWLGYIGTAWNWLFVELYITITMYVMLKKQGINPISWKEFNLIRLKHYIQLMFNKAK